VDGYGVVIEEIRACGREAVTAGEDTRKVDLPGAAAGVEPALPGGAAAAAARQLSSMWEFRLRMLGDDVVSLGTDLNASADKYATNEVAAIESIESIDPRYRRYE
jgi:hypothetical protein